MALLGAFQFNFGGRADACELRFGNADHGSVSFYSKADIWVFNFLFALICTKILSLSRVLPMMPLAIACLVNFNGHADDLEWNTGVISVELPKEAVTALPLPVEVGNMLYVSIMLTGFIDFLGLTSTMVTVWKEYVRPSINQLHC